MATIGISFDRNLFMIGASLFILSVLMESANAAVDCSVFLRCDECLVADPSCMWCDDQNVLRAISSDPNNTESARLCGDQQRMTNLSCNNIVDPSSTVQSQMASAGESVSISTATVNLRPGKAAMVNIDVSPPQSSAVDMYLLMDFTQSMRIYLQALRSIASDLVTRLSNMTTEFRIGFGSFVDKQVIPFLDPLIMSNPCIIDPSGSSCAPSYDFRNEISLTSNASVLIDVLNNLNLSGGLDPAEGILDALLQTAVCEDIIGWRPQGQSQRIVVAFTDEDYHYALDAKIAGIAKPPTSRCAINPVTMEYESSSTVEFPSAAFISSVLNENQITPIFAVPSGFQNLYYNLVESIGSATVANLQPNAVELLDLIVSEFQRISGTVIPTIVVPDAVRDILSISITPVNSCSLGSVHPNASTACVGITYPDRVSYELRIEGTQDLCGMDPVNIQVQFIRFGSVNVTVIPACTCDCTARADESSAVCSNSGTLECSACMCDDLRRGATCQCPAVRGQQEIGCTLPESGKVCSGHGQCNCGQCQCDSINGEPYHGQYCQFDPSNCPSGRDANGDLKPCSGNGQCNNVQCVCGLNFGGRTCDCTNDNSTCIYSSGDPSKLCSDEGQCVCGQCVCNDYSLTLGQYCEDCLPCRTSCSMVSPCVLCMIVDGMECPANLTCKARVTINDAGAKNSTQGMKVCSIRKGSCEVRYFLDRRIRGDESAITVFMDDAQSSIPVLQRGSTECQQSTLIWPFFVGIIGGTVILGIVILVLWRGCTYLGEYLEYQQWEKSIKNDTENTGENPLFVGPKTEYTNPRYVARH